MNETTIEVDFWDPSHYLANATIHYFWFINTVNYGQTQVGKFVYNFSQPMKYTVEVTAIAYFNTNSSSSTISLSRSMDPEQAIKDVRTL